MRSSWTRWSLSPWGAHHPIGQAPRAALGAYRRPPARRLPCAARRHRDALLPPTAAALCRAAFAGGPFPWHAFERSRAIASPSCSSLRVLCLRSRTHAGRLRGVVIDRVFLATRTVFAVRILIVTVFFGTEAYGAGRALVRGALRSALGFRSALRRLAPASRGRVWAEGPVIFDTRVRRGRWSRRSGARGTCGCTIVSSSCFAHRQRSALELLIVEAVYRFLGVGPFAKLHECEPARSSGVTVCGQSKGSQRADCSEVCTQFSLGHVIREVPNKKAHSH